MGISKNIISRPFSGQHGSFRAGTFNQAANFGEAVVFSFAWAHAKAVIDLAKPASFSGKVVLDTSNPLVFE